MMLLMSLACQQPNTLDHSATALPNDSLSIGLRDSMYQISKKGKLKTAAKLQRIYTPFELDTFGFPVIDHALLVGLERQRKLLKYRKPKYNQRIGDLRVDLEQLQTTVDILEKWQHLVPIDINHDLQAHQIKGKDGRGNVKFTGYFTPIIPVNKRKTKRYPYPIHAKPKDWEGPLPDRQAIEEGALDSVKVVLAYAKSKVDIYYMQLQGSGYVEYPNGERQLLAYSGSNGHPYRSIESYLANNSEELNISNVSMDGVKRYLKNRPEMMDSVLNVNPSYTFFRTSKSAPKGAGQVPLSAEYSIAVDTRYIPLGSCFLAAVPKVDKRNKVIGHDYKILLAQDVGGAIRGPGHIDFYFGIGKKAQRKAKNFNAYGRLWLLLPQEMPPKDSIPPSPEITDISNDSTPI